MYADLNEDKTEIVQVLGPGSTFETKEGIVVFGANAKAKAFTSRGLFKLVSELPDIPEGKKHGEPVLSVKSSTVTLTYPLVDQTSDEERASRKAAQKPLKLAGVDLDGVMCSATRKDQNGLVAVALAIRAARDSGAKFPETQFEFENGAELIINDDNFDEYYASWVTFRQSFFKP